MGKMGQFVDVEKDIKRVAFPVEKCIAQSSFHLPLRPNRQRASNKNFPISPSQCSKEGFLQGGHALARRRHARLCRSQGKDRRSTDDLLRRTRSRISFPVLPFVRRFFSLLAERHVRHLLPGVPPQIAVGIPAAESS